jgi:hypothetical protein
MRLSRATRKSDTENHSVLQDVDPVGESECRREYKEDGEFRGRNAKQQKIGESPATYAKHRDTPSAGVSLRFFITFNSTDLQQESRFYPD